MNNQEVLKAYKEYQEFIDSIEDPKIKSILSAFIFVGVCLNLGMSREQILEVMENENL